MNRRFQTANEARAEAQRLRDLAKRRGRARVEQEATDQAAAGERATKAVADGEQVRTILAHPEVQAEVQNRADTILAEMTASSKFYRESSPTARRSMSRPKDDYDLRGVVPEGVGEAGIVEAVREDADNPTYLALKEHAAVLAEQETTRKVSRAVRRGEDPMADLADAEHVPEADLPPDTTPAPWDQPSTRRGRPLVDAQGQPIRYATPPREMAAAARGLEGELSGARRRRGHVERTPAGDQALIPGTLEAAASGPQVTEGNLPGEMFTAEAQARREGRVAPPQHQEELFGKESPPEAPTAPDIAHFGGDPGRYTGKTDTVGGQKFYEIEMLEGRLKGKRKFVAARMFPDGKAPDRPAEAPKELELARPEPQADPEIADFGEKIGGARKDVARPLGPRPSAGVGEVDERPAWQRKYRVFQDANELRREGENAKWTVVHGDRIVYSDGRPKTFATKAEAEAALPLYEVARNHRVLKDREGDKFSIYRTITDRKRAVVKGGFETEEAAKKYMATHPEEIIDHKFPFPEKPWLDRIERVGKDRRSGKDVSTTAFRDAFGFRGGEFGNWNMGSDGQAALNHAYDALLDLADTLNVPPKALSLNGDIAIAFGARGHGGKDSARAHYEAGRAVINLTKIKGAGSLAHEWFHALDNYLSKQDKGEATSRTPTEMVSHGFRREGAVRSELRQAFENVIRTMTAREETRPASTSVTADRESKITDYTRKTLDGLKRRMGEDMSAYSKRWKKPTEEQLREWDETAEKIASGDPGKQVHLEGQSRHSLGRMTFEAVEKLNDIYKAVTGRSFSTADENSTGRQLVQQVASLLDAQKRMAEAVGGATEVRKHPTDFLRNSKEIDSQRASDYWSTPHEMGARAFESFVYDKLVKGAEKSDYLAHGVENKHYAAMDLRPYPEGAERTAINSAFEDLFRAIKSKETEKGTALYSAQPKTQPGETLPGITADDVKRAFAAADVKEVEPGEWLADFPGDRQVRVRVMPDGIEVNRGAFEKGYGREFSTEAEEIVGSWQRIDRGGLVSLAKEADQGTVHHEAFHVAMDLALSAKEKAAVLDKYKTEEAASEAYAKWSPAAQANGWFSKILAYARRIYRTLRPSWESSFERARSGEAYGRRGLEPPRGSGGTTYATAPAARRSQLGLIAPLASRPGPPGPHPAAARLRAVPRPAGFTAPEWGLADKIATYLQDRLRPLEAVEGAVRRQGGTVGAKGEDIKAAADALGSKVASRMDDIRQKFVDPLVAAMGKKVPLKDLDDYMAILHAPDRDALISRRTNGGTPHGSGWAPQERTSRWAELEAQHGTAQGGRIGALESAAAVVRGMRDEQLRVLEDGGLLSAAQISSMKSALGADYVPFRTDEVSAGLDSFVSPGTGQGFDIRGRESKTTMGRTTKADSPVAFMLQQLQRAVVRAEKNKVDQQFADFVRTNNLFEIDKAHERTELDAQGKVRTVRDVLRDREDFSYKVDGESHRIDVASVNPLLDRALRNMSATEMDPAIGHMAKLTRRFSALVTSWNPAFIFTNFTRDIQGAVGNVTAEHGATVAKDVLTGIPTAMREMFRAHRNPASASQMAKEFKDDGGSVGWYSVDSIPQLEKRLTAGGPGVWNTITRAGGALKDVVEVANKSVENGTRFATYVALRKAGASRQKAAHAARNVTLDFSKKGEAGPTLNALYAFFNANVQGIKRMKEVVIDNPRGRAVGAGIVALGMAMDAYNRANAGDENKDGTNDYDAIPEYVKQRNFVVMRGEGKRPLLFPLPYGFNILHTAGRQVMGSLAGAITPPQAALGIVSAAYNAFNPLGGEADLAQTLSPTVLDPFIQHATNRTWTGRPLQPEGFPGAPKKPPSESYFRNVSPAAKSVAKWLNESSGGDAVTPGYVSWSPEVIGHYVDAANSYLTGGLGKFALETAETGKALAEGEAPELRRTPILRRFVYEESAGLTGQRYRQNLEELEQIEMRYKAYRSEGNRRAIGELPLPLLRVKRQVDSINLQIGRMRRAAKAGRSAADLEQRIEDLQNRANRIVAAARRAAR